ncbi:MAG: FecR family protein [Chitinophagaceae bacterium]|nr:FecR family protein [Chitinophagaceae bacterium]
MATSQHLIEIIRKHLQQQTLSAEEQLKLKEWLNLQPGEGSIFMETEWEKDFSDYLKLDADDQQLEAALQRFRATAAFSGSAPANNQSIQIAIEKGNDHRVHFIRKWWWAAAIFILFGTVAYLYTSQQKEKPVVAAKSAETKDILPGGERAILTLADGSKIALDSAATGQLAKQGNASVIKLANGEIRYDVNGHSQTATMMNTMSTPRGGQYQLILPDGSKVWLNAASAISYPTAFTGNERRVKVSGEVFLEVAQNKEKPFVVDVDGKSTVQVLGTSFNINSYADEGNIKTTLIDGSVKINQQTILKPGQQATVAGNNVTIHKANTEQVLAWKNGNFDFTGLDFKALMRQLERWYDIDIKYERDLTDFKSEGQVDRGVSLTGMIRFLSNFGIKARLEGRVLIIE